MTAYVFALVLCVVLVLLVVQLLRSRKIREKYATVWILLAVVVTLVGAFPDALFWLTRITGVLTPVNLLFAVGFVVVLGVCIQLSASVSALEERVRTLTEEVALLELAREQRSAADQAVSADEHKVADVDPNGHLASQLTPRY